MGDTLLLEYMEVLKIKGLTENTRKAYLRDIRKYMNFLNSKKEDLFNADVITIMAYVQEMQKNKKANSSIVRNIISIRRFYRFLLNKGFVNDDPTYKYEIPKVEREIPEVLTIDEVNKLLNTPDLNTDKGIRDKAMLEVMYASGMKVTEFLNLTIYDINLKSKYIKCIGSKNKKRIIPIGLYAVECLSSYLTIRSNFNKNNLDYLFFNSNGMKLTRQGFWKIVKSYAKDAGINKNINVNTLRHSFAVHLLQNGADIRIVKELLGHSSISATQIYSGVCNENKIMEVYKNTHPRA